MPNFAISDMPPIVLPIDPVNTFLETETVEGGVQVSRQISAADLLGAAPGLDATFITLSANVGLANERILTAGADIGIVDGGAGNPITISVTGDLLPSGTADFSSLRYDLGGGIWVENTAISFQIDSIFVDEKAAALADVAGRGQVWVRNDVPNVLMFTDDLGNDFVIGGAGGGFATLAGANVFTNANAILLPQANDAATPTLAFGDGDTGFYETTTDDQLVVSVAGVARWFWLGNQFTSFSAGAGPMLLDLDATDVIPNICPNNADANTGIGWASGSGDQLSLIAGGVQVANLTESVGVVQMILPLSNTPGTPTLAFGDGDTGFYQEVDAVIAIASQGTKRYEFGGNLFQADAANGPLFSNLNATSTNPTLIPSRVDANTGIGWSAADQLSLIAGGAELIRLTEAAENKIDFNAPLYIGEQAAAFADVAGDGQLWVANDVANTLRFTDDIGTEMRVNCTQWFNKFGDQQFVNNTTVFVNVTSLSGFQFDLGAIYHIEIFLKTNQANASADIAVRLNPQGAGTITDEFFEITSISDNGTFTFQDNSVHTALGATQNVVGNHALHIVGTIEAGVADLWDLQFAQGTAQVANTIIDDASYARITKIG